MLPTDIRNDTWRALRDNLSGRRAAVLGALIAHGPCDTAALSGIMGWSVLAVRPRVCELAQLGFVECIGRNPAGGVYRARTDAELIEYFAARREAAAERQAELSFR
jgi:hypothetical protein